MKCVGRGKDTNMKDPSFPMQASVSRCFDFSKIKYGAFLYVTTSCMHFSV